ncbi:beta-galactosidase [Thalassobacillus pellis]|uniref:beta-galactosidase n=1 Tax=Thalassobacillus pellis TaxID=748008 RepID=UPI001960338E|nr:beta-galactosidase [Thalassobacillus pellis]
MKEIRVESEKIIINGKETIVFGGELHYFRIPKEEWKDRIRQVKEAGINMISTYVPWIFHEYEEGYIDLTGETRAERDFRAFLQLISEEDMYCLVRPGPYVMAEIVDHGVPTWFLENYPDAMAQTEDGNQHPTRVVSYMHPAYLRKVETWYHAVCSVIKPFQAAQDGPVIMFQLDNEVGMFHWVTNEGDYNEVTRKHYEQYLEEKPNVASSNHETQENIASDFPVDREERNQDYYLFMREHYRTYLEFLKETAQKEGITVPFLINIHGFHTIDFLKRGTRYPVGISQLLETSKMKDTMLAGDYYIGNIEYDNYVDVVLANAFTKAIQPSDQPLFSAEFQGGSASDKPRLQPETFDLTTRLCFANGMNAVNYYMFVGGENYENIGLNGRRHEWQAPLSASGEKRPHFHVIRHLGKMFHTYEKPLLNARQVTNTCFAFYPDYYMTEYSNHFSSPIIETFQRERDLNIFNGMAKGLRVNNIVFESLNIQNNGRINVEKTPTLWMFSMNWMGKEVQQKLVDYIEDGGQLILFPSIPTKDLQGMECTVLKDYLGASPKGRKTGFAKVGELDSVQVQYMEAFDVEEGAFAWSEDEAKEVVAFEKRAGKGKAVVFGIGMDIDFDYKKEVIRQLAERVNVRSDFSLEQEVDISIRSMTKDSYFVFLHNFDGYKKKTTVHMKNQALFGGAAVTIPPKSGLMLPVNVPIKENLTLLYGTAEVFDSAESVNSLTIKVRLKQAEELLVINSDKWEPHENPGMDVKRRSQGLYEITLHPSLKEEMNITFTASP